MLAAIAAAVLLGTLVSHAPAEAQTDPACATPPSGLGGWWPWEGDGTDIKNGNNATLRGQPQFVSGKVNQALQLDSSDGDIDYAEVPTSSTLDVGTGEGLTIEAWINPKTTTAPGPLVEWNTGSGTGQSWGTHLWTSWFVRNSSGGDLFANIVDTGGGWHIISTPSGVITPDTDQHVALTYDKANRVAKLYRNGTEVATQAMPSFTSQTQTTHNLYFGYRPAGIDRENRFNGTMDEVGVYSRALSQQELQGIHKADKTGKC